MTASQIKWTFGPFLALVAWIIAFELLVPLEDLDVALVLEQLVVAIGLIVVVRRAARFDQAGWRWKFGYAWLWLAGPLWLALTPIGIAAGNIAATPSRALLWLTAAVLVGFVEETVFRGFLFNGLQQRMGVFKAALASSVMFGLLHVCNALFGAEASFLGAQIVLAFGLGMVFALMTVRSGSVWPAVFLHAAADAVGLSALGGFAEGLQSPEAASGMLVFGVIAAAWGIFWFWLLGRRRTLELAPAG